MILGRIRNFVHTWQIGDYWELLQIVLIVQGVYRYPNSGRIMYVFVLNLVVYLIRLIHPDETPYVGVAYTESVLL